MERAVSLGPPAKLPISQIGGRLCFDFANTMSGRTAMPPRERVHSYADLVNWAERFDLLSPAAARRLRAEAEQAPEDAALGYAEALELREAIYRIFSATIRGERAAPADFDILNGVLAAGMAHRRLEPSASGFCWSWDQCSGGVDWLRWPVAYSAAELLTSGELERVKECRNADCNWLFLDLSKNRSRCWCDMRDCGNRAKARRFRARRTSP